MMILFALSLPTSRLIKHPSPGLVKTPLDSRVVDHTYLYPDCISTKIQNGG